MDISKYYALVDIIDEILYLSFAKIYLKPGGKAPRGVNVLPVRKGSESIRKYDPEDFVRGDKHTTPNSKSISAKIYQNDGRGRWMI